MVNEITLNRWMNEYINNIDLSKRKYLLLSPQELELFVRNNYYDNQSKRIVTGENDYMPIGLQYLDYANPRNKEYGGNGIFLICYVENNIGKNTILSELKYYDNCNELLKDQVIPITFIEYAEVNKYFRNLGLYKELVKEFSKVINRDNPLLTTNQSLTGFKFHTYDILEKTLIDSGFKQDIRYEYRINQEYYDFLRTKQNELKITKKTSN